MSRPLRVLVDARMLIGRFSGVARFVTSLVDGLARDESIRVSALCSCEPYAPWAARTDIDVIPTSFNRGHRAPVRRLLWEELNITCLVRRIRPDAYHATWNTGVPRSAPCPTVLTVHDLIPWDDPVEHLADRVQRRGYRAGLRMAIDRAARITTVTEAVRHRLLEKLLVDPSRIVTILNGVEVERAETHDQTSDGAPSGFVLYVGGQEARKNIAGVLRTMQHLWTRELVTTELWLTGKPTQLAPDARSVATTLTHSSRVRFLGDVSDAGLAQLYRSAVALITLSRDEGFGLPLLEAMAHGCPVIASNIPAHAEVASGAAFLVAPDDTTAAAAAVRQLQTDPDLRRETVDRGLRRAADFSWQRTTTLFSNLYHRVCCAPEGLRNASADFRPSIESS